MNKEKIDNDDLTTIINGMTQIILKKDIEFIEKNKYDELQQENQQLKEKLKQRDEVIEEVTKYVMTNYVIDDPVRFKNSVIDILNKYKGDNNDI